jgi:hypothetical protein
MWLVIGYAWLLGLADTVVVDGFLHPGMTAGEALLVAAAWPLRLLGAVLDPVERLALPPCGEGTP